jgi:hypothetical protein
LKNDDVREGGLQCITEFFECELVYVIRIGAVLSARFVVVIAVRRRNDKRAVRIENASSFRNQRGPIFDVLDHFEGGDEMKRTVAKRQIRDGTLDECARWVVTGRVADGVGCDVDPDSAAEVRDAVTRSATEIEHSSRSDESGGECVSSYVLRPKVIVDRAGNDALARELSHE